MHTVLRYSDYKNHSSERPKVAPKAPSSKKKIAGGVGVAPLEPSPARKQKPHAQSQMKPGQYARIRSDASHDDLKGSDRTLGNMYAMESGAERIDDHD